MNAPSLLPGLHGFSQGAAHTPAPAQAHVDGGAIDAGPFGPGGYGQRFAFVGEQLGGALVAGLLRAGSPSAVIRRVRTVVVDSVEAGSNGPSTHIGVEVRKRVLPPLAHLYAAPPVAFVVGALGVVTTCFHALPSAVFGRSEHAVCLGPSRENLSDVAAAALDPTGFEFAAVDLAGGPTVADAKPVISTTPLGGGSANRPAIEPSSGREVVGYSRHRQQLQSVGRASGWSHTAEAFPIPKPHFTINGRIDQMSAKQVSEHLDELAKGEA